MIIRDVLHEINKNLHPLIKTVKVVGTTKETRVQGCDDNRVIFLDATLAEPVAEFEGEFGIGNLDLLKGLLSFAAYKSDKAKIAVKRRPWNDASTVETIDFRDASNQGTEFRCMSPERVPQQAEVRTIPWDITFRPSAEKLTEFSQLAGIFASVDTKKLFGVKLVENDLVATFGSDHASTHRGSMVLAEAVKADFKREPLWNHADFIALMKLAGTQEFSVRFSEKGVLGVEITTPIGAFKYYLRSQER